MNSKKLLISFWAGYICFLLFWMVRFWDHFPAFMDTLEYVFPEKWFNVESFQKGFIPLWNPYIACGTPHVANFQSAAFYPFFWIWNITGLTHWFFMVSLFHSLLATVGFYFWLRSLNVLNTIAVLCAISFSGSAYLTLMWGFPTHLASLAWIPWVFWGSMRLINKASLGRWLALVSFWTFQILAGYPIFTFYAFLFWFVFLLVEIGLKSRFWLFFISAWVCAFLVTACQWLPFLDFLGYMHRESWGMNLYNLKWGEYATLLSPNILGMPGMSNYKGDYGNFIFGNFYLCFVPLFVLILSFGEKKVKFYFWKISLIFTLFLPLGSHCMLWRFMPDSFLDKLEISKSSFLFPLCAFTTLGIYLNLFIQKKSKKSWIKKYAWIFILIWVLDLILIPFRIVHMVPDPYQNKEVKNFSKKIKEIVGDGRLVSLRFGDKVYSSAVTDYVGSYLETAKQLTQNTNVVWGIKSAQGHLTTVVGGYQNLSKYLVKGFPYSGRVLDAANVDLIISPKLLSAFKYRFSTLENGLNLIRNAGAMSNQWETDKGKIFNDRVESFTNLLNSKLFLENECDLDRGENAQVSELATISQYITPGFTSPCLFQFNLGANSSRYFIFDQCFAPGWHAWVDGLPSPILRADGLFMALKLGVDTSHEISFQYSPLSFRLGLFITLITLAGLMVLCIRNWFNLHFIKS